MGRGNVCTFGEYEGLYYVDWDNFETFMLDADGNETEEPDYALQQENMEADLMHNFSASFMERFRSFTKCDEWDRHERHAIMENKLFKVCLVDNEWSMAVMLVQKDDEWRFTDGLIGLQKKHFKEYMDGMRDCLFELFPELGTYKGAWTSGRIKRPDKSISQEMMAG